MTPTSPSLYPDAVKEEQFSRGRRALPRENGGGAEQDGGEGAEERCLLHQKEQKEK